MMSVKILGIKEVSKNIDKATKMLSKANTDSLIKVGEEGVSVVKRNTPIKDGRLRNSMTYSINGKQVGLNNPPEGKTSATKSDAIKVNKKDNIVILGTNVIYAKKVEYFAKGASKGYMLRSLNQIKRVILPQFKKRFKAVLK